MENILTSSVKHLSSRFFDYLPPQIGFEVARSTVPLPPNTEHLIIREDNSIPDSLINVFNSSGTKVFTIERPRSWSTQWNIFTEPQREQVASVTVGLFQRRVHLPNETDLRLSAGPGVLGKLHRHFYTHDGQLLSWNRRTYYLEIIANPFGEHEEYRARVAYLHQLRARRFDWELIVDTGRVSLLQALTTALATLKTQYRVARRGVVPGARHSEQTNKLQTKKLQTNEQQQPNKLQTGETPQVQVPNVPSMGNGGVFIAETKEPQWVFEPQPESSSPRNFFNPPKFLEHLYR